MKMDIDCRGSVQLYIVLYVIMKTILLQANTDILALATSRSVEEISLLDAVDTPAVEENMAEGKPRITKRLALGLGAKND